MGGNFKTDANGNISGAVNASADTQFCLAAGATRKTASRLPRRIGAVSKASIRTIRICPRCSAPIAITRTAPAA